MANFEITYNQFIKPFEGGYVNIAVDKGGETYAGIARNKFPNWQGWTYIDFVRRTKYDGGTIPRNTAFPDIQYLVDNFYKTRWLDFNLDLIQNQNVASLLFDYIIHSGSTKAITAIQRIVKTNVDGIIGPKTIAAINGGKANEIFLQLLNERAKFLNYLVINDATQKIFEAGWKERIKTFRNLLPSTATGGIVVALILITAYTLLS